MPTCGVCHRRLQAVSEDDSLRTAAASSVLSSSEAAASPYVAGLTQNVDVELVLENGEPTLFYWFSGAYAPDASDYPIGVKWFQEDSSGGTYNRGQEWPARLVAWSDFEKQKLEEALGAWLHPAGIRFRSVATPETANLKFHLTDDLSVPFEAAQLPPPMDHPFLLANFGQGLYVRGRTYQEAYMEPGGVGFTVLLHELGHGLGLAHPHDTGLLGDSAIFEGLQGEAYFPWRLARHAASASAFTVMSYSFLGDNADSTAPPLSADLTRGFPTSPGPLDLAALAHLYGLSSDANASDLHTFDTRGGRTIYDTAGQDLLYYDGADAVLLDLRPASLQVGPGGGGHLSRVARPGAYSHLTIGTGVVLENARGGTGDDFLHQVDSLTNLVDGAAGVDVVVYSDARSQFALTQDGAEFLVASVAQPHVADRLSRVEFLSFADGWVSLRDPALLLTSSLPLEYALEDVQPLSGYGSVTSSALTVPDAFFVEKVELLLTDVRHDRVSDLVITLRHEEVVCTLVYETGARAHSSGGSGFQNATLSDDAEVSLREASTQPLVTGAYRPYGGAFTSGAWSGFESYLSAFLRVPAQATWTLEIQDRQGGDSGALHKWGLRFFPSIPPEILNPAFGVEDLVLRCGSISRSADASTFKATLLEAILPDPQRTPFLDKEGIEVRYSDWASLSATMGLPGLPGPTRAQLQRSFRSALTNLDSGVWSEALERDSLLFFFNFLSSREGGARRPVLIPSRSGTRVHHCLKLGLLFEVVEKVT